VDFQRPVALVGALGPQVPQGGFSSWVFFSQGVSGVRPPFSVASIFFHVSGVLALPVDGGCPLKNRVDRDVVGVSSVFSQEGLRFFREPVASRRRFLSFLGCGCFLSKEARQVFLSRVAGL